MAKRTSLDASEQKIESNIDKYVPLTCARRRTVDTILKVTRKVSPIRPCPSSFTSTLGEVIESKMTSVQASMTWPVVISKRGKPMAKLVPVAADEEIERHILERLRAGEGGMRVDEKTFLEPSSRIAGWSET